MYLHDSTNTRILVSAICRCLYTGLNVIPNQCFCNTIFQLLGLGVWGSCRQFQQNESGKYDAQEHF